MEAVVASFEAASVALAGSEFPQVLLLHADWLNSDLMPELLAMFRRRGYEFVTLDSALADDAYRLADEDVWRSASIGRRSTRGASSRCTAAVRAGARRTESQGGRGLRPDCASTTAVLVQLRPHRFVDSISPAAARIVG
jgi:hypothetical protein